MDMLLHCIADCTEIGTVENWKCVLDTIPFTRTAAPSLSMAIFHRLVLVCVLLIFFFRSFVRFDIFCCLSFLPLLLLLFLFLGFFFSLVVAFLWIYIYFFSHFLFQYSFHFCVRCSFWRMYCQYIRAANWQHMRIVHTAQRTVHTNTIHSLLYGFGIFSSVTRCVSYNVHSPRERDNFLLCFMRSLENLIFSDYLFFFFLFFLFLL